MSLWHMENASLALPSEGGDGKVGVKFSGFGFFFFCSPQGCVQQISGMQRNGAWIAVNGKRVNN